MDEPVKSAMDWAAVSAALAAFAGWLPTVAALASLIWTVLRIFETRTVQNWLHRHDPNWTPIPPRGRDES